MIDLWIIRTHEDPAQSGELLDACAAYLADNERARAARFHFPVDGARFALCRSTLRRLLSESTGLSPLDLSFQEGAHGKPFLAEPENAPHFNLSHTKGLALIAISKEHAVGVDTEAADRSVKPLELAPRVFTPREIATLEALDEPALRGRFFRYWTAKEAFLKGVGRGLSLDARKLEASLPETPDGIGTFTCADPDIDATRWRLHEFHEVAGFHIALATHSDVRRQAIRVHAR